MIDLCSLGVYSYSYVLIFFFGFFVVDINQVIIKHSNSTSKKGEKIHITRTTPRAIDELVQCIMFHAVKFMMVYDLGMLKFIKQ